MYNVANRRASQIAFFHFLSGDTAYLVTVELEKLTSTET